MGLKVTNQLQSGATSVTLFCPLSIRMAPTCHTVNITKLPFMMNYLVYTHLSVCHLVLFPSFHLFFSSSRPSPLLFGLCACGRQGNSSNLPTHVPVGQGAIRGQSTSLSSCHKWCWRDGEGPRPCFEGQRGRSPPLCQ